MKTTTQSILIGLMTGSAMLTAGSVTIPNTFSANTTAKASEVNANFSAVKTAVDGNANDMVKDVNVGSGLTVSRTNGNITIKKASGYVAVHASAFASTWPYSNYCDNAINSHSAPMSGLFFSNISTVSNCEAYAPVDIPNGATITGFTCRVKHNVVDDLYVRLYMQNRVYDAVTHVTGNIQRTLLVEATLDAAHGNTADTQEISGSYTPGASTNPTYRSYFINWDPPQTSTADTNEALFDCKVDYEY